MSIGLWWAQVCFFFGLFPIIRTQRHEHMWGMRGRGGGGTAPQHAKQPNKAGRQGVDRALDTPARVHRGRA